MIERSRLLYDNSIEIKAGETKILYATLETRKDGPGEFSSAVIGTDRQYGENTLPIPPGLEIAIEPSKFSVYPNSTYHFTITIKTAPQLATGEYWLRLESNFENVFRSKGWIRVKVV